MIDLPWYGYGIAAVIMGGGSLWWLRSKLKAGERAQARAVSLENLEQGRLEAMEAERRAYDAMQAELNRSSRGPTDF